LTAGKGKISKIKEKKGRGGGENQIVETPFNQIALLGINLSGKGRGN